MKTEIFKGHVVQVQDNDFFAEMEDSSGVLELWCIEKKRVPEVWLQEGAVFQVEVGEGLKKWTFDTSVWTAKEIKKIKKEAKALAHLFGKRRPVCRKK